jgi:hypothetical protein
MKKVPKYDSQVAQNWLFYQGNAFLDILAKGSTFGIAPRLIDLRDQCVRLFNLKLSSGSYEIIIQ